VTVCPDCRCVPAPPSDDNVPGVGSRESYDEIHHADCPRVALSREARARVDAKIESSFRAVAVPRLRPIRHGSASL
jgi:hypothetical protein